MTLKTHRLRDAIVTAIVAGLGAASAGAHAQEVADEAASRTDPATLDTVTVTGSRITIPGVTSSSPVTTVDRDEFMTSQPVAVEDFIKNIPAMTPAMGPGMNNGTAGAATLDLRGLRGNIDGANRTLVLVDGRRPVPFNLSSIVDTNTIPLSLLQSVDVLTGGASVVYGADAVAGVVNFILRRNFEGAEFTSTYGQSKYGDGARQRMELTVGANSEDGRGNVVLSLSHSKVDPVLQGDRPWSVFALDSETGQPGGSGTAIPARFSVASVDPENISSISGLQIDPATGALVPTFSPYNYNPANYYQTGMDRYQATALGRFELNDHAEVYADLGYTRSAVDSNVAASGIFGEVIDVPIGNPYMPEAMRQQVCEVRGIAAAECVSGPQGSTLVPMSVFRRIEEFGPRINDFNTKTFQVTVGLRGDLNEHWRYDTFWSHGESSQLQTRVNWGSLSKVRQALNALTTSECVDSSNGCVPLNVWGQEGSITPDMVDFINLNAYLTQDVEQDNAAFTFSGDLGELTSPWSDYPIGLAAGAEYRKMRASTRSDAASQILGEVMGTGAPSPDTDGSFSLLEGFAEAIVPLVSGVPGASELSLELGYRRSDFKPGAGGGTDYGSWKYGLEWAPVDSLRFRGMFQRATRAPNVAELFTPQLTALNNLSSDPCAGNAITLAEANTPGTLSNLCRLTGVPVPFIGSVEQPSSGQINVLIGGNPTLSPELADTRTLGFVWTPSNALALTIDYWNIEIEEAVSAKSVADVIEGCYSREANADLGFNEDCALIGRSPANGTFNGSEAPGIALLTSNLGRIKREGVDLGLRYSRDLPGSYGSLDLGVDITRYLSDDFQATPASDVRDCLGYYSKSCTPSHELKSAFRATWSIDDVALSLVWRHLSGIDYEPIAEPILEAFRHIPSANYLDLAMKYKAPFNGEISLAVNNLTDRKPPIIGADTGTTSENSGNTFPTFYDSIGRYYTMGVTFRF